MNQVQRILESDAPIQVVAGQKYKGQNPEFTAITNQSTGLVEFKQVSRGIPFVRVS